MKQEMADKLRSGKRPALATLGTAALAGILALGVFHATPTRGQSPTPAAAPSPSAPTAASPSTPAGAPLTFEVASIKPNHSPDMRIAIRFMSGRFSTTGSTVRQLITLAYNVRDFQVSGGPSWIGTDKYDIEAKESDALAEELQKIPPLDRRDKMAALVQSLLADRFALKVSHGSKELPVYALVVAKNGPKIQAAKPGDTYPNGMKTPDGRVLGHGGMMGMMSGQLTGQGVPIQFLVQDLSQRLGRTVLDQTGLKGNYDFTLKWTPEQGAPGMMGAPPGAGPGPDSPPPPYPTGPSIFTAVQEQLGLKLEPTKGPVEMIIIDHVEKPSEN
jgi:uncharacterized protein (TIGR03435 family)